MENFLGGGNSEQFFKSLINLSKQSEFAHARQRERERESSSGFANSNS
jgi:hypothetical protein